MSLNTTEAIYEVFHKATRDHIASLLRHDVDWKRFHAIGQETKQRLAQEQNDWESTYHSRLAEARQIILRETHGNILEPPKPEGIHALPDKKTLDLKADQRIRTDHERRLAVIKQDELDQYEELKKSLVKRDDAKGHAKQDFERVANEAAQTQSRSGPSRS